MSPFFLFFLHPFECKLNGPFFGETNENFPAVRTLFCPRNACLSAIKARLRYYSLYAMFFILTGNFVVLYLNTITPILDWSPWIYFCSATNQHVLPPSNLEVHLIPSLVFQFLPGHNLILIFMFFLRGTSRSTSAFPSFIY